MPQLMSINVNMFLTLGLIFHAISRQECFWRTFAAALRACDFMG